MVIKKTAQLSDLMNVGKATLHYLALLNIHTVEELSLADPDELYTKLEIVTKRHYDPCLWDLFAAIIHQARTGQKNPWWKFTPIRKQKEKLHSLCAHKKK